MRIIKQQVEFWLSSMDKESWLTQFWVCWVWEEGAGGASLIAM